MLEGVLPIVHGGLGLTLSELSQWYLWCQRHTYLRGRLAYHLSGLWYHPERQKRQKMGGQEKISGRHGKEDAGAVWKLLQWSGRSKGEERPQVLERSGQRRVLAVRNWLPLRSVLSHRLENSLGPSGTYITQEGEVSAQACVKYNIKNYNS